MFPQDTWKIYNYMLKQNDNFIRLDSHVKFLEQCIKENLIPKGLYYKSKVNYNNNSLQSRCQKILDKASMKSIKMTVNWLHKQISHYIHNLKESKQTLLKVTHHKDYQKLISKMNIKFAKRSKKLKETKGRKLTALRQIRRELHLEAQPNLKEKRNRRKHKNKRKRDAKSKRLLRKRKIEDKQSHLKQELKDIVLPLSPSKG